MSVWLTTKETGAALPLHSEIDHDEIHRTRSTTGHEESEYRQPQQQYHRDEDEYQLQGQFQHECNISRNSVWEIEEEEEEDDDEGLNYSIGGSNTSIPIEIKELFGAKRYFPMPSIKEEQYDINGLPHSSSSSDIVDCVYVAVGKSESSMDALNYAVKQLLLSSNTILYLIHIFPEIKYIPSPLGKLPKNQVSPEQVESFMAQESDKRRQLLQKYIDKCSAARVKMDTLLIESDMIAKAIVDLIPILNIRKLVLGTKKSNLSRKLMSGKGARGIADQVLQSAPQGCEINIICEGNQVMINDSLSPRGIANDRIAPNTLSPKGGGGNDDNPNSILDRDQRNEACSFLCFKPMFSQ
ncbi:U-box domain-containing protein 35 isoform X1 [Rosa chinensis]|uniref:U-box domain-containing protein 35 isoform X1 n=1 Tax=Rosa chinensis TaxID=74649 RepID=UPI000D0939A1|nr:U-box domain-containing protein 35 isoform X1 [Rosa chinensis]